MMPIYIPKPHLSPYRRRIRHAEGQNNPQPSTPHQPLPKSNPNISESSTRKLLSVLLKCIIMTFILSLFLLFIGFAALLLIHFLLLTTTARRRRHRRRSSSRRRTDGRYYSFTDQDIEDLIPSIRYSSVEESVKDCAICLESFKEGENCRKLVGCNHLFHVCCVDSWLIKVPNCPVCRNPIRLCSGRVASIDSEDDWRVWWPVGG